jgi:hypothetical protein
MSSHEGSVRLALNDQRGLTSPSSTSTHVHVDLEELEKRSQPTAVKRVPKKPESSLSIASTIRRYSGAKTAKPQRSTRPNTARLSYAVRPSVGEVPERGVTAEIKKLIDRPKGAPRSPTVAAKPKPRNSGIGRREITTFTVPGHHQPDGKH